MVADQNFQSDRDN